jgi:hypothetical protein
MMDKNMEGKMMPRKMGHGSVYKDYTGLCEFKKMSQRHMGWPKNQTRFSKDGVEYVCRPMKEDEIDELCALYRIGVPECKGTNFDFLHHPDAMQNAVGVGKTFMKKDWFIHVIEDVAAGKLCGACASRADRLNMTIWGEVGVIDPHYRQRKIFSNLLAYMNEIWPLTGAEYGLCWVATFHTISQKIMERHGWTVCGFFRGGYIMNHGGGKYYRHPVILIEKFFNDGEKVTARHMDLTETSRAILNAIESAGTK